jgi:class 3 adenylate cyclase
LDINLICSDEPINLYHNVPEAKIVTIKRKLIPTYIGKQEGTCNIYAEYASDSRTTPDFEINKKITVKIPIEEINLYAGKNIIIKGEATKANNLAAGRNQEAFVDIILDENTTLTQSVNEGLFSVNFSVPLTTHAGAYSLRFFVYEKDENDEISNSGETSTRLIVLQKPAKVSVAIDKTTVSPEQNISLIPFIYDAAGDSIKDQLVLRILDVSKNIIYESVVNAEEEINFELNSTTLPGYSSVIVEKGNLSTEKTYYISELKKISAQIKDGKVIITNTGNIPYGGAVEITFGGENFVKDLELGYQESKSFDLTAPDGYYNVNINDGNSIFSQTGVSLTGNTVSLRDSGVRVGDFLSRYPIVWIFLSMVMGLFVFTYYKKSTQNKRLEVVSFNKKDKQQLQTIKAKGGIEIVNPGKIIERIVSNEEVRKAEQVTVLHGQKQNSSIVAIKIKNDIKGIAEDNVTKALEYGYKQKAVSYSSGDSVVLIFSPRLTRKAANEESAIKVAIEIDNFLKEHNRKFRNDKIQYGIGVNSGDIINKLNGKVLQFANINRTISLAKKVADLATDEVLLSKDVHEKTMNSVKSEKIASGTMDLFSVKRVVDTQASQKFIGEFLKRNDNQEKL